jgi:predicted AAA+ superfamily ATPase
MTEQKQASIKKELERYQLSYRKDGETIVVRQFGKKNVFFLNVVKEMNFIVPDEKLAIQVSYSINEEATFNREVSQQVKYSKAHEDWKCLLITFDEEGTEEGIFVVPVWKWLMEV